MTMVLEKSGVAAGGVTGVVTGATGVPEPLLQAIRLQASSAEERMAEVLRARMAKESEDCEGT